jgi:uncharacterized SAM-binding protein YcdF (DUF218 family)
MQRPAGTQICITPVFAWAGGDLALMALAAVSVWQLRGYSAVAHPATGSLGIDPVAAIAPALAVAAVALIPLRGLPLLARLADKATDHARRLATAMVSWQIARSAGRSPSGTVRPAARRYGTRPPTSWARPRCMHASTRRWTGWAGFSCRGR